MSFISFIHLRKTQSTKSHTVFPSSRHTTGTVLFIVNSSVYVVKLAWLNSLELHSWARHFSGLYRVKPVSINTRMIQKKRTPRINHSSDFTLGCEFMSLLARYVCIRTECIAYNNRNGTRFCFVFFSQHKLDVIQSGAKKNLYHST